MNHPSNKLKWLFKSEIFKVWFWLGEIHVYRLIQCTKINVLVTIIEQFVKYKQNYRRENLTVHWMTNPLLMRLMVLSQNSEIRIRANNDPLKALAWLIRHIT